MWNEYLPLPLQIQLEKKPNMKIQQLVNSLSTHGQHWPSQHRKFSDRIMGSSVSALCGQRFSHLSCVEDPPSLRPN